METIREKTILKVGSLFSGVGGIDIGFEQAENPRAEFRVAWASEFDPYAAQTYRVNHPGVPMLEGDINDVILPKESDRPEYYSRLNEIMFSGPIDVLEGGPPCQAFSVAGLRKGFEDKKGRGVMFHAMINVIDILDLKFGKKPRFVLLENVKNLKTHDGGNTYRVIRDEFEKRGYTIKDAVLNTMNCTDVPQNRERIFMIAFLSKEDAERFTLFDNPEALEKKHTAEDWERIVSGIIDDDEDRESLFYTKEKFPHYFVTEEEYEAGWKEKKKDRVNLVESVTKRNTFYQIRRGMYIRENRTGVCPTLTANMGAGGHNVPLVLTSKGIRKLSEKEAFLLQGFPVGDGFTLPEEIDGRPYARSHLYKQAGNAVSVPVLRLIAQGLLDEVIAPE